MTTPPRPSPFARVRAGRLRIAQLCVIASAALAAVVFGRAPESLGAHDADPTYAQDVAPILFNNCASCHHPGGLGPFSVLDYDSTKKNIAEMRDAVASGAMPPWQAVGEHGVFKNDRRISEQDKQTILRWIDAGAKKGDLASMPRRPDFSAGWEIGTPDLVVSMPEEYTVPAKGTVDYQYFAVPTGLTEEKWVQAVEIHPGAREVVHHVIVYAKVPPPTPTGVVASAPPVAPAVAPTATTAPAMAPLLIRNRAHQQTPDVPRLDSTHAPMGSLGVIIGTTAPGTNVVEFAKGTALRLRPGTILTFQMHYTAKGHEMHDRSSVGFRFAKEMPDEEIYVSHFFNAAMSIPAGAKDVPVTEELGFGQPIKIWGLLPHTHLRGKKWQYVLQKPDGTSETVLDIPNYDFNWQTYYQFTKPLEIAPGSKLVATAWYDNSATNKSNPDPTKDVKWGDQTWEEMQYTGFMYSVPSRRLRPAAKQ